jgi:hypothetical protein
MSFLADKKYNGQSTYFEAAAATAAAATAAAQLPQQQQLPQLQHRTMR